MPRTKRTRLTSEPRQEVDVYSEHPLMYFVWHNHCDYLTVQLRKMAEEDEDKLQAVLSHRDFHGRTLLQLAVELFHRDAACELMAYGAQIEDKDSHGFTVLENVIATQDLPLLQSTYLYWQYQRSVNYSYRINCIFEQFAQHNNDFYFEIDHTFVRLEDGPLLNVPLPLYPYTKYRVYKLRHKVCVERFRINSETHGKLERSYIFVVKPPSWDADGGESQASMVILDHSRRTRTLVATSTSEPLTEEQVQMPDQDKLVHLINRPPVSTLYNVQHLKFEKKWNLLGMAKIDKLKDKYIKQPNRFCAVYEAQKLVESTLSRVDHLERKITLANLDYGQLCNPHGVTLSEYYTNATVPTKHDHMPLIADIGLEKKYKGGYTEQTVKLWLFKDNYPLTVRGHLMPVLELLALTADKGFEKCRAVVGHHAFPHHVGYPIKVEFFIPKQSSYAVSKIKFTNFNGLSVSNPNVTVQQVRSTNQFNVNLKRELFRIPQNYNMLGGINI